MYVVESALELGSTQCIAHSGTFGMQSTFQSITIFGVQSTGHSNNIFGVQSKILFWKKNYAKKQKYDDKIRDPNLHCNNKYVDEFILQGWEVVLIAMNPVVTVRICPKGVQQTGLLFCTPSFPSTPHSPMWIALQSSTPIYPRVLECSTHGVALRNALDPPLMYVPTWVYFPCATATTALDSFNSFWDIVQTQLMSGAVVLSSQFHHTMIAWPATNINSALESSPFS